jgi:hypothetical protein
MPAKPPPAMEVTNFMNNCLCNAWHWQGWLDTDNTESQPELEEKSQDEFYHESMADLATRIGHSLLILSTTQYIQQNLGLPTMSRSLMAADSTRGLSPAKINMQKTIPFLVLLVDAEHLWLLAWLTV